MISDSHGAGSRRIKVNKRGAKLVMNANLNYCDFITDIFAKNKEIFHRAL